MPKYRIKVEEFLCLVDAESEKDYEGIVDEVVRIIYNEGLDYVMLGEEE